MRWVVSLLNHLLSLDEPRALGLVLVVSGTVRQVTRGPRQPETREKIQVRRRRKEAKQQVDHVEQLRACR